MITTKGRLKVAGFGLLMAIAIFGIFFHLYNHAYASAALLSIMILPAIFKRQQIMDKWCGVSS